MFWLGQEATCGLSRILSRESGSGFVCRRGGKRRTRALIELKALSRGILSVKSWATGPRSRQGQSELTKVSV